MSVALLPSVAKSKALIFPFEFWETKRVSP